jgi:ankyrin repeat protein
LEADPNLKSKGGFTALAFAARQGKIAAATTLLDAGVDVNDVIDNKSKGERNPRDGMSPLMLAVESGHFELAIELVRRGADPNDERSEFTPLHAVVWTRKANVGDDPSGDPIPQGSGSLSSLDFVREIVALGADVNRQLRRGAGGRAKLNLRDATPFLMAAKTADLPLLKLLLESGANPTLTNADGTTPILATAGIGVTAVGEEPGTETEVIETIDWLVRLGADVNAIDENGETAMHGAAYRNYPIEVEHLAKLGADPAAWNRKNEYGWTPIMIAQGQRPGSFKPSPETIAALERAMTKTTDNDRVDK